MIEKLKEYYLRPEIASEIVRISKAREVVPVYEKGFGKRPNCITFERDFIFFVEQGALEFNGSVELWRNPMLLEIIKEPEKIRIGWDLIIDIDCDYNFEISKMAAQHVVDALKLHDIKNVYVKFSGNRGFHIGIGANSFPKKINNSEMKNLYPELLKKIISYIKHIIKEKLENDVFKKFPELGNKEIYQIVHIEENWGPRHLFRLPYSINMKAGLISLPIQPKNLKDFEREEARIEKIAGVEKFLETCEENEALELVIQALDHETMSRKAYLPEQKFRPREFEISDDSIPKELFPKTIHKILAGLEDGRKRSLFILIGFLRSVGWKWSEIEKEILEWNKRNKEPLRENYIKAQLNWHKRQKNPVPPPNFDAPGFYKEIGVLVEEDMKIAKNPVAYSVKLKKIVGKGDKKYKKILFCEKCGKKYKIESAYKKHASFCF